MKKGKRPFVSNPASSDSGRIVVSNVNQSTDSPDELSAYEALMLKRKTENGVKASLDERKVEKPIPAGRMEDSKLCSSSINNDGNLMASNICSRKADESNKKMDGANDFEKKQRLTREDTREEINRKRKSVDKRERNGSAKTQKPIHSDISVFSCLFEKPNNLLSNSGKKRKKKLQKKIQTAVSDRESADHLSRGKGTMDKSGGKKTLKNVDENDKEVHDRMGIYSPLIDDVEERTENDAINGNIVKCNATIKDKVHIDFEQKPFSTHCDSVQNGLDALQWLIHPYDVKQFFKTVFQKKVFHVSRNNTSYYGNLFSTEKFIDILRTNYVEYGTNVNVAVYKNQQRSTLNGSGKVYPQEIQKSIKDGCSVQLTNPQSFSDNVWYYCDLLQEIFGCFVGANSYITPANTAGFAPHWDDIDAFLLQLEGRKHWRIYAPIDNNELLPRLPSDNFTDSDVADRTLVFDDWLEQGEMLYIPRGFIHQGSTDKALHSLHLTVSVCRNVAYADLLERIIPPALSNFAEQHANIRKSLPPGYLDMTGVLECAYPLKTGSVKLHHFLDDMFSNFCEYIKELNEPAIDMMAREFMRTALPPVLTEEEKDMTALCIAGSSLYGNKQHVFTKDTPIKLLRRHGQRLIYESEERCFIVHRIANSRVYEGRPETLFDLDVELVKGFAKLLNEYPRWCLVSDLKCNTAADNIRLAELLYKNGLLMAKFAKIVGGN